MRNEKYAQYKPYLSPNCRNCRIIEDIGVEEHNGDVRFKSGSGNMAVSCMCNASGHYRNSSFIVDLAMGQIPRSRERISSYHIVLSQWYVYVRVWRSAHVRYSRKSCVFTSPLSQFIISLALQTAYSCNFHICDLLLHFHPCNFALITFSIPAFSVAPSICIARACRGYSRTPRVRKPNNFTQFVGSKSCCYRHYA